MKISFDVAQHPGELCIGGDDAFGNFSLLENFLGLFLILPKIRMRGFCF
jgi:hypothetical protein